MLADLMVNEDQAKQNLLTHRGYKAPAYVAEDAKKSARNRLWCMGSRLAQCFHDRRLPGLTSHGFKGVQSGNKLKWPLHSTGRPISRARKSKRWMGPEQLAALVSLSLLFLEALIVFIAPSVFAAACTYSFSLDRDQHWHIATHAGSLFPSLLHPSGGSGAFAQLIHEFSLPRGVNPGQPVHPAHECVGMVCASVSDDSCFMKP